MDWQVKQLAGYTGSGFALGLYAGLHLTPGGLQHEKPTFEVIDACHAVQTALGLVLLRSFAEAWRAAPGPALLLGMLVGLVVDHAVGVACWYLSYLTAPFKALQAVFVAWLYGLPKLSADIVYARWTATASLVLARDAPAAVRLAAVAYEVRLCYPYYASPSGLRFWFSGVCGPAAVLCVCLASGGLVLLEGPLLYRVPFQARMALHGAMLLVPANRPLLCLGFVFGPAWLLSWLHPGLGALFHVACRASEFSGAPLVGRLYGGRARMLHANWSYDARWESAAYRRGRLDFWRRYHRAVRLEKRKAARRARRLAVGAILEDLGVLPAEVAEIVLEYLGLRPDAGTGPDHRSYELFKRRKRRSPYDFDQDEFDHPMGPFGPGPAMLFGFAAVGAMHLMAQGGPAGRALERWAPPFGPAGRWGPVAGHQD